MTMAAYRVGAGIFLLGADDGSRSLSCVQCRLALDDSLTVDTTGARTSGFAADTSDTFPILIGHGEMLSAA